MHWVIKDSTAMSPPPTKTGTAWPGLRSLIPEPSGGIQARTRQRWTMRRVMQSRVTPRPRSADRGQAAGHPMYVPWDARVSAVAPDALTAWCEDTAGLRASILARTPVIVVPSGAAGSGVLDEISKLDGIAFARIGRGGDTPDGEVRPGDVRSGDVAMFTGLVKAALDGMSQRADHRVVTVEGSGLHAPEVLAVLLRLADDAGPGPRRVQVALAGGPGLYIRLAEARLQALREEAQAEAGPEAMAMGLEPKARLTGGQWAGAAAVVLVLMALAAGPLVSLGFSGHADGPSIAAPVPMAAPAVAAVVAPVTAVPVLSPAQERARQRREFEEALAASGKDMGRMRALERERLFRNYRAREASKLRHGLAVVDYHR